MPENKTQQTDNDVTAFLMTVDDETKRNDCFALIDIMRDITGDAPTMWGTSIIGFGKTTYQTADGKSHDWFEVGFSPRKASLTLYIINGFNQYQSLLDELGKYKTGKSCLYVKKLADIDESVLRAIIQRTIEHDA